MCILGCVSILVCVCVLACVCILVCVCVCMYTKVSEVLSVSVLRNFCNTFTFSARKDVDAVVHSMT